jgi:hypothetical protein
VTVQGLPLHPLVVHATVVALPVLALVSLAYLRPSWRETLRWPLVGIAVVSAVLMWLTSASGDSLKHDRFGSATGLLAERIHHHEDLAGKLAFATYVLAAVAVVVPLLRGRLPAALLWVGSALLVLGAVGVGVLVVLTGHAGAQAAWAQ